MIEIIQIAGFFLTFSAAVAICFGLVGSIKVLKKFNPGLIQYFPHVILFANGLAIFLSTRRYSETGELFSESILSNPLASIAVKLSSVFCMLVAIDQISRYLDAKRIISLDRFLLASSFALFWLANVLFPAFLGTHTERFELSWLYSLILGLGFILTNPDGAENLIKQFRNTLLAFCGCSLFIALVKPDLVLQSNYVQGYIPGLPRFAGLAPHAILMGVLSALALFCLYVSPFSRRWLNILGILCAGISMFLAQSKNVWIAFVLLFPVLICYRPISDLTVNLHKHKPKINTYFLLALIFLVILIVGGLLFLINGSSAVGQLLDAKQSQQLFSITGRDRIWEVAIEEWRQAPWFGYGLSLFGDEHRRIIDMYYATSGHNQIYDNLARSGLVGLVFGVSHFLILLILSIKYRQATRGLSVVLALFIFLRMISEVPVTLLTIGLDTFPYYLLMALIGNQMKYEYSKSP